MHQIKLRKETQIGRLAWTNRLFWKKKMHFSEWPSEKKTITGPGTDLMALRG
jgi:hypothetical protein